MYECPLLGQIFWDGSVITRDNKVSQRAYAVCGVGDFGVVVCIAKIAAHISYKTSDVYKLGLGSFQTK